MYKQNGIKINAGVITSKFLDGLNIDLAYIFKDLLTLEFFNLLFKSAKAPETTQAPLHCSILIASS